MALQSMIDKLNNTRKAYEDQLKELGKDLGKEVAAHLGSFLPDGVVLEWRQGTPSFNDGDPCRFSVKDAYVYRIILDEHGEDPYDGEHPEDRGYRNGNRDAAARSFWIGSSSYGKDESLEGLSVEQYKALCAAWDALPEDLMERAFGDGAHVKVRAGGEFTNNEYYE